MKCETALVVPDMHCPHVDERALGLVMKVGAGIKPDHVICLGDAIDNEALTLHEPVYKRNADFQADVDYTVAALHGLKSLARKKAIITLGNHDIWFNRYFATHAPKDNRRENDIAKILKLDDWKVIPYQESFSYGKLRISHEFERCGKYAAYQVLADVQTSVLFGHTHRLAAVYEGDVFGNRHVSAMLGWLGDVEAITYKHKMKARKEWQLGFGVIHKEPNGICHVQAIPIIKYHCFVDGKLYTN